MNKATLALIASAIKGTIADADRAELLATLTANAQASGEKVCTHEIKSDSLYSQWATDLNVLQAVAMPGTNAPWFLLDANALPDCIRPQYDSALAFLKSKNHKNPFMVWGRVKFYGAYDERAYIRAFDALSDADKAKADRPRSRFPAWVTAVEEKAKKADAIKKANVEQKKKTKKADPAPAGAGRTAGSMAKDDADATIREVSDAAVTERALRMFSQQEAALLTFADQFVRATAIVKDTVDMPADVMRTVEAMVALFNKGLTPKIAPLSKRMASALSRARQELTADAPADADADADAGE